MACALTLLLLAFGVGLGLSVVSPWAGAGVSGTTFKIGTGLYLVVIAMLSSSIGGYLAGRLRTRWVGVHTDEVYFRDTAHGFIAWALASVIGAVLLATPAASLIGAVPERLAKAPRRRRASPVPWMDMVPWMDISTRFFARIRRRQRRRQIRTIPGRRCCGCSRQASGMAAN